MLENINVAATAYRFEERPCPICGSNSARLIGRRGGSAHRLRLGVETQIVRCDLCCHLYPFPFPIATNLSDLYGDPAKYFVGHDPIEKKRSRIGLVVELERLLSRPGRLLDVGSGCGELLAAAVERGWSAVGVETAKQFCEYSSATYGVEVINSELADGIFERHSFDAVTLAAVLEHVEYPMDLLRVIGNVLKPGGVLFLDVPNEGALAFSLVNTYLHSRGRDWAVQLAPTFPPYHIQGFSKESLRFALNRSLFDISSLTTYAMGNDGFHPQSLIEYVEAFSWRAVDRLSLMMGQGTGLLVYANKRTRD